MRNFFVDAVNDVTGTTFILHHVILPLGHLSFYNPPEDRLSRRCLPREVRQNRNFVHYGLFVLFFPQLIAGPIVHFMNSSAVFDANFGSFRGSQYHDRSRYLLE